MSVGATTKHLHAPALVHREPVRGGLVLSGADRSSTMSASQRSQHAGGPGQRSGIGADPFEVGNKQPHALSQRWRSIESP